MGVPGWSNWLIHTKWGRIVGKRKVLPSTTMSCDMYAVIATGGKQEKVAEGQVIDVERLSGAEAGASVPLRPILLVDDSNVVSTPSDLAKASVEATVVGEVKGP